MLLMKEVNLFTKYLFTFGWHLSMNTTFMTKSKIIQFCRCGGTSLSWFVRHKNNTLLKLHSILHSIFLAFIRKLRFVARYK